MLNLKLIDIKKSCTEAAETARSDWRKDNGRSGCLFSRGRELAAQVRKANGSVDNVLEAGAWPWDGTLRGLQQAATKAAEYGELVSLHIDGGFNYSDSPRAYQDGDYDPWAAEWSVPVWVKP